MANKKQQKQKERERRVAKEKLAATAERKTQEKTGAEVKTPVSRTARIMSKVAAPKADHVAKNTKTTISHRRTGG